MRFTTPHRIDGQASRLLCRILTGRAREASKVRREEVSAAGAPSLFGAPAICDCPASSATVQPTAAGTLRRHRSSNFDSEEARQTATALHECLMDGHPGFARRVRHLSRPDGWPSSVTRVVGVDPGDPHSAISDASHSGRRPRRGSGRCSAVARPPGSVCPDAQQEGGLTTSRPAAHAGHPREANSFRPRSLRGPVLLVPMFAWARLPCRAEYAPAQSRICCSVTGGKAPRLRLPR
jgi:hypothetical protein